MGFCRCMVRIQGKVYSQTEPDLRDLPELVLELGAESELRSSLARDVRIFCSPKAFQLHTGQDNEMRCCLWQLQLPDH